MSKRNTGTFFKIDKDKYMTWDKRAVSPLMYYLEPIGATYYEPCVGEGHLIKNLTWFICVGSSDSEMDARTTQYKTEAEYFITNPPWTRSLLHPIIENLRNQKPTWLLFDADWMHTQQAIPYMRFCEIIISVGRLKWIPNTTMDGYDNCAWYKFVNYRTSCQFIPRRGKQ